MKDVDNDGERKRGPTLNPQRHVRVKEVFLEAIKRQPSERAAYLETVCGSDRELRREVESLLRHHSSQTIVAGIAAVPTGDTSVRTSLEPAPSLSFPRKYLLAQFLFHLLRNRGCRIAGAVIGVLLLLIIAVWTNWNVEQALRGTVAEQLRALLDADVLALEVWIEERKAETEHWAEQPQLRQATKELADIGRDGPSATEQLRNDPAQERLQTLLQSCLKGADSACFSLVDRTGLVLASMPRDLVGTRLSARVLAHISGVFDGKTEFIRPYEEGAAVTAATPSSSAEPLVWILAPVRDDTGETIAVLGLARSADENFTRILGVARMGKSGETYAFDKDGVMLSESRFEEKLKRVGLLNAEPNARSMLHVPVRDPGGDVERGHVPSLEPAAWPLTKLAALAIASRNKQSADDRQGVILDAYRNYRGVLVVGAWKWLAEDDFGVATEVEAREAFAPVRLLEVTFLVLLAALVVLVGVSAAFSLLVSRLARQVGEARRLGQYTLVKRIGEGGVGKVYLARHALLKRPTAIKVLRTDRITKEDAARFEREVQLASQLTHPNTIEIYDYGRTAEGVFYYAMEYLPGLTLTQLVALGGAIPPARAIHILRQVCGSLGEAHALGLIHRDIKPSNIMLCQRGGELDVVKVLDFGLVKYANSSGITEVTPANLAPGTPLYMAPERLRDPSGIDARSDIYSLGAVGYKLLAGRDVFESADNLGVLYQIINEQPLRLARAASAPIPSQLDELIAGCLAKDVRSRPTSVDEVLEVLDSLRASYPWEGKDAQAWWHEHSPTSSVVVPTFPDDSAV